MTWRSVIARLILCPVVVTLGDYLFAGISFAAPSQRVAVGVVMAILGVAMDTIFPDQLGIWWSFLLQAVLVAGILRLTPAMMPQVTTTRPASAAVGAMLGVAEVAMYWLLFRSPGARRIRRARGEGGTGL